MRKGYEIIEHTADIGIRARGSDLSEAFGNAARGLFSLITDIRKIRSGLMRKIEVSAPDREALLVQWLNELIYVFDTEKILFKHFNITGLTDLTIKALCYGEKVDKSRHELKREIKSATYHMLKVEENSSGEFIVEVIVDV